MLKTHVLYRHLYFNFSFYLSGMKGFFTILLMICVAQIFAWPDSGADGGAKTRFLVLDKKTHLPLEKVEITITSVKDPVLKKVFTSGNGMAEVQLAEGVNYRIEYALDSHSDKYRYFTKSESYLKKNTPNTDTVELERIERIVCYGSFPNIYFASNSAVVEDTATLNMWLDILIENPTLEVELTGHSDCKGTRQGNLLMSKKRADVIAAYMFKKGIAKNRIATIGWGDTRAVNACDCKSSTIDGCGEEQYAKNRRVEIKFMKL
ncbi:MAG: ompA [Bacteroidota bacterium]|nr:ompA [Bacteroidota bacterium]